MAALEECCTRVLDALERGAAGSSGSSPAGVLHAVGGAYAELVADRDLLMLRVHAQAATDEPAIASTVRRGIGRVTDFARTRSLAGPDEIQRFMAFGQLCHLLTTIEAFDVEEPWASTLTDGIRRSGPEKGR